MITVPELSMKLKSALAIQIDNVAKSNPMIGFMKPLITRAINKNFSKVSKLLYSISDENDKVDIENILPEMIQSVANTNPFVINTPFLGDIKIGGGLIELNIPMTTKGIIFNEEDLKMLQESILNK